MFLFLCSGTDKQIEVNVGRSHSDFIYHYTFFEITKFSKILSKLTFFRKISKFLSNFESIFEINVNFESIFENFVISKKMSMVDEVTITVKLFVLFVLPEYVVLEHPRCI